MMTGNIEWDGQTILTVFCRESLQRLQQTVLPDLEQLLTTGPAAAPPMKLLRLSVLLDKVRVLAERVTSAGVIPEGR